jgi:hypothetical protein
MTTNQNPSKGLNIGLWAAQGFLALMFIMPAFMKMFQSIETLSGMLPWAGQVSPAVVRGLGFIDLLGGLGIILPSILRTQPRLTVLASIGGILLMVSAIIFHLSRGEGNVIGFNILLVALLAFVAWGRSTKAPIYAK